MPTTKPSQSELNEQLLSNLSIIDEKSTKSLFAYESSMSTSIANGVSAYKEKKGSKKIFPLIIKKKPQNNNSKKEDGISSELVVEPPKGYHHVATTFSPDKRFCTYVFEMGTKKFKGEQQ